MITKTKQNWTAGQTVKVGFLQLRVIRAIPTPGDYAPDAYVLANLTSTQLYKFVPHNGLEKISLIESRELIAASQVAAERAAAAAIAVAKQDAAAIAEINDLIFG